MVAPSYPSSPSSSKAIMKKIIAMLNVALNNPTITKKTFNKAMPEWEGKLDRKLASLTSNINLNTNWRVEA